ncbi:hypothetical protein FA048_02965 [Pedobacter polaris]|uniref:DUF4293 family protein n=1 Tax=Pedobacter polaris TaxID=2571273 RepID=A0A4U1CUN9_9SPHI|nr:hypothetical protein [Pedobacter polaris]TKC12594.1 hypothetical protein FA048_02965 [Pedobacter polaris]
MKNLKFIIATLLLATGISSFIYWFTITAKDISFDAMKAEYATAFPSFLQNTVLHTFVIILILVTAGVLYLQSRMQNKFKIAATGGMILSFLLAFWQLFSLM